MNTGMCNDCFQPFDIGEAVKYNSEGEILGAGVVVSLPITCKCPECGSMNTETTVRMYSRTG